MTAEQAFFLSVLADHLNRRRTAEPAGPLDWKELLSLGRIHQVGGILYAQCQAFLPEAFERAFAENYGATLYHHGNRRAMEAQLTDALRAAHIPFFILKGAAVAAYYPVPALRTMGDTDVVVHTEDRRRAHEVFLAQGCRSESQFEDREWVYRKDGMEFELHDHLVYRETINRREQEAFFNDFWRYVHGDELDRSFHLLFLLLHLRKHLMNEGVGFRQFMDVAAMTARCPELDWPWIRETLEELGMGAFAGTVFAMDRAWFGIEAPLLPKEIDAAFLEEAADLVFRNGVFGFHNTDNRDNGAINVARNAGNAKLAMARSAIRMVFPTYEALIVVPQYRFLKGRPWLLPAAWAYRVLLGVRGGKVSHAIDTVQGSFVSEEAVEKRSAMLERWGL